MPPMAHTSSKPAPISQRGAKVCSRSTQFTAMSEIPYRSHLRPEAMTPMGCRYPRSCRRRSSATISNNSAVMFVARYTDGPLKLYAGYEHIRYMAPSDPQTAFTDIAGSFLCQGCEAFNNTNINNTAFGVNGLGNKTLHVMWVGTKYAVTENQDVIAGYYHYIQDSYFGTLAGGPAPCSSSAHSQCAGTFDAISAAIDWRFA